MYAIVQSEKSEDALNWVLETMCKFCPGLVDKVRTVFTDRGVAEHLIQGIFRNAKALLCTFHIGLNLNACWGEAAARSRGRDWRVNRRTLFIAFSYPSFMSTDTHNEHCILLSLSFSLLFFSLFSFFFLSSLSFSCFLLFLFLLFNTSVSLFYFSFFSFALYFLLLFYLFLSPR